MRRAVRVRDGDRCAFRSDDGKRCEARTRLEFHHVVSVARGGFATVDDTSLRCRAHNQYEAECELGVRHMEGKRERARSARGRSGPAVGRSAPSAQAAARLPPRDGDPAALAAATAQARIRQMLADDPEPRRDPRDG